MVIDIDVDEEQVDKALEGLEAVEGIGWGLEAAVPVQN